MIISLKCIVHLGGEKITISKYFSLLKINIDLQTFHPTIKYDLIYFDAFSPKKQPELWTYDIFKNFIII